MSVGVIGATRHWRRGAAALAALACVCALSSMAPAASAAARRSSAGAQEGVASLGECVAASAQTERSATFAGEMTAVPGTVRMAIRIEVQEQLPGQALFHMISAPGLGVWRASDPKVKTYKYLKQVTNLSAPAVYRALVRFRWTNVRGHVIRRSEHFTAHCVQPAPAASEPPPPQPSASPSGAV